jgi:AraC-like DNA-binding protein
VLQLPYLFFEHTTRIDYVSNGVRLSDSNSELLYLYVLYTIGVYVIFNIQILYYAYQAIKRYKQHKRYIGNHFSYTENISLRWILALIISVILLFAINEVLYLIGFKQHYVSQIFYNVSMLVITLFAAYRGMLQKELILRTAYPLLQIEHAAPANVIKGQPEQVDDELSNEEPDEVAMLDVATAIETQKYAGSGLSTEQKQVLINKLEHLIRSEKLFVNCNLTVEDVASRLEARPKHVSQVINEHYQRNFYNFINYYRIVEAQQLLLSAEFEKYSIQGIAQMVGFVSKSTFNAAFKKQTGKTPSEFKKN